MQCRATTQDAASVGRQAPAATAAAVRRVQRQKHVTARVAARFVAQHVHVVM